MKKLLLSFLFSAYSAFAIAQTEIFPANQISLPNIDVKQITNKQSENVKNGGIEIKRTPKSRVSKNVFNPKSSGLTNYQYDDKNYKYNKLEKYIKDNIQYSKSGSTKLY